MKNLFPLLLLAAADEPSVGGAPVDDGQPVKNELGAKNAAAASVKAQASEIAASSVGVQGTLSVLSFVVAMVKAVEAAEADGKIDLTDLADLAPVAPTILPMIKAIGDVPKELGDLDSEEVAQLVAKASEVLGGLNNAKTVLKIKDAIAFAQAGYKLFGDFKS